jgi:cellulose synthase/poly-beta-1,6-N-acetylglucosamine synthase-like glycosyltransferase
MESSMPGLVLQAVIAGCFAFLLTGVALSATWCVIGVLERRTHRHSERVENVPILETSRFTIPVSVVVPAYNEETVIVGVVQRLLALQYPTFEVIVVNDGSTDGTLQALHGAFGLARQADFDRGVFPTREVRAVYRSTTDARLVVIDKVNGGKADSLNCGINFSCYRYVCCVDGDTIYEPDALLKGMRLALKDPARVIGVTSHLNPTSRPEMMLPGRAGDRRGIPGNWLVMFQQAEYLRSFLNSRLAWSRGNYMLNTAGAFMLYRRDVVEELGGFSTAFTCEDIELTFRAHERYRREGRDYRILSLPDTVGHTEAPERLRHLISQRARWQRVTMETTWHYRRMLGQPRYGLVGFVGAPYYALYEALSPVIECASWAMIPLAVAGGVFDWHQLTWLLTAVAFTTGIYTNIAILLDDDGFRRYRLRDLVRLILCAPLELFVYRPLLLYARCRGMWEFFRGHKSWERFDRNPRHDAA